VAVKRLLPHTVGDATARARFARGGLDAVVLDLGVLGAFKYYGFFAEEINGVLGDFGLALSMPLVAIAIPLGVSFFVFHVIKIKVNNKVAIFVYLRIVSFPAAVLLHGNKFLDDLNLFKIGCFDCDCLIVCTPNAEINFYCIHASSCSLV
jgi:hypothetical protein